MKLFTQNLKRYSRLFSLVKSSESPYYDHVFLDFRKKTLNFFTESILVRIDLELEGQPEEEYLYVDGLKFFFLVMSYEVLEIKNKVFYGNKNKFSLPLLEEDFALSVEEDYDCEDKELLFSEDLITSLNLFKDFLDKDIEYPAVFFNNSKIIALSSSKCMQASSGLSEGTSFSIPTIVIRSILSFCDKDSRIHFRYKKTDESKSVEFNFENLFYKFSSSSDVELPVDPEDPDFVESYNHPNYFNVEASKMTEALKVLSSFAKIDLGHCKFSFDSETNAKLTLISDSEVVYNLNVIEYSDYEYFKDKSFWISLTGLASATSALTKKKVKNLQIHYSEGQPTVKINDSLNEESLFIVQALIEDPSI